MHIIWEEPAAMLRAHVLSAMRGKNGHSAIYWHRAQDVSKWNGTTEHMLVELQARLTAAASYAMQCVEYLVSGSYSVSVRQQDGSQTFASGTANTATIVSGGCLAPYTTVLEVDAVTEYDASFSGDKFVLGYRTHFIQSACFRMPNCHCLGCTRCIP